MQSATLQIHATIVSTESRHRPHKMWQRKLTFLVPSSMPKERQKTQSSDATILNTEMTDHQKESVYTRLDFAAGMLACFVLLFAIYAPLYKEAILQPKLFFDFDPHMYLAQIWLETGKLPGGHYLFHILAGTGAKIFGNLRVSTFVVVMASELLTAAILYTYIFHCTRKVFIASMVATSIMLAGPLCLFAFKDGLFHFGGYLNPNILHSPTMSVLKPVALLLFILTDLSRENNNGIHIVVLVFLIIVSAFAKPSYIFIMLPAIVVLYAAGYRAIGLKNILILCAACIMILLWMYASVYITQHIDHFNDPSGNSAYNESVKISLVPYKFSFGHMWQPSYTIVIMKNLLSLVFPLYVLIMYRDDCKKDFHFVYACALFVFAWLSYAFLYESNHPQHGNFGWSSYTAVFLLFLEAFKILVSRFSKDARSYCGAALLALHVIFGIGYCLKVSMGWGYV